jgi:hypothetical protein
MSSAGNLVIAGVSYVQDNESEWNEQTVLLVYNLENNTSVPKYVGASSRWIIISIRMKMRIIFALPPQPGGVGG